MSLPTLKGFLDVSFVDWPGKVAAVVFLPGCNFRCPYCHNRDLVLVPDGLASVPVEGVLARLEELGGWVDGVCVTGGEPTLHPGLPELLALFRSRGLAIKLDTNGSHPEGLAGLLAADLLEAVALDLKAPLEAIPYRRNAGPGADPAAVGKSLALLAASELGVEVRTTVHPVLLSLPEVRRLAAEAGTALAPHRGPVRFTLQRCRTGETLDPSLSEKPALTPEEFARWEEEAQACFAAQRKGAARGEEGPCFLAKAQSTQR
ncbi:MAG: anaerobic ribonucleoside-triphosphate reductase activating protein [Thermodesulfobacteriota bacterium]